MILALKKILWKYYSYHNTVSSGTPIVTNNRITATGDRRVTATADVRIVA